jgi:type I restriction enzyme, R subunit
MFGTSYDTSADKFQNYYKDLSERVKNREVDILLVVNMFLTGFDATTLNIRALLSWRVFRDLSD